ncbi:MAG: 5-formyltetrahydrofolate cyclo-ligase [Pseudomonadota bacterium]|nr:5-formyltetrahydrofolate cyclo-ligase [Pseudomonadota bacterium]
MTLSDSSLQQSRAALRADLRRARRSISSAERARCARRVTLFADRTGLLHPALRIGLYLSLPEELDTGALLALARRRGCRIYLPRIDAARESRSMQFVGYGTRVRHNRFGIPEPRGAALASARLLDVLFIPLVGFDRRGNRLGMGGGYYDRALAFTLASAPGARPLLVGLAYALQQLDRIERAAHDVPLDMVITERSVVHCGRVRTLR